MTSSQNPNKTSLKSPLLSLSAYLMMAFLHLFAKDAVAFHTNSLEVQVVDADHHQLPSYHHRGGLYVMGRHHQRYMIKVTNHHSQRVEVVLTVDGRDVINGKPGAFHHRGYVVDPYETIFVEGFRRSADEVATFRFTTPGDSYAQRMGAGENVGVIGVAAFHEQSAYSTYPQYRADDYDATADFDECTAGTCGRSSGNIAPSPAEERSISPKRKSTRAPSTRAPSARPRSEIGTRYGERRHSRSHNTSFVRASHQPFTTITITYDSEKGLRRRGVIYYEPQGPSAFPSEHQYAPPPPYY